MILFVVIIILQHHVILELPNFVTFTIVLHCDTAPAITQFAGVIWLHLLQYTDVRTQLNLPNQTLDNLLLYTY